LGKATAELHKKQSGKKKFFDFSKQIFESSYCKEKKKKSKKQSFVGNLTYAGFNIELLQPVKMKVVLFFSMK